MGFHRRLNLWHGLPLTYHDLEWTSIVFRDVAYISSFGLTFNGSRPAIRIMSGRVVPTGLVRMRNVDADTVWYVGENGCIRSYM